MSLQPALLGYQLIPRVMEDRMGLVGIKWPCRWPPRQDTFTVHSCNIWALLSIYTRRNVWSGRREDPPTLHGASL